jgi:hypothetical protein
LFDGYQAACHEGAPYSLTQSYEVKRNHTTIIRTDS